METVKTARKKPRAHSLGTSRNATLRKAQRKDLGPGADWKKGGWNCKQRSSHLVASCCVQETGLHTSFASKQECVRDIWDGVGFSPPNGNSPQPPETGQQKDNTILQQGGLTSILRARSGLWASVIRVQKFSSEGVVAPPLLPNFQTWGISRPCMLGQVLDPSMQDWAGAA